MATTLTLLIASLLLCWLITNTTTERTHSDELKNHQRHRRTVIWLVIRTPGRPIRLPLSEHEHARPA